MFLCLVQFLQWHVTFLYKKKKNRKNGLIKKYVLYTVNVIPFGYVMSLSKVLFRKTWKCQEKTAKADILKNWAAFPFSIFGLLLSKYFD